MQIAIGSDHRGFELKQEVIELLSTLGHDIRDCGCYDENPVDYPDVAKRVAKAVAIEESRLGILICSTGIGMSIAANKVKGIRAALCCNGFTAARARMHNDANVLCIGADTAADAYREIVAAFLDTAFEGGRHQRRINIIGKLEE